MNKKVIISSILVGIALIIMIGGWFIFFSENQSFESKEKLELCDELFELRYYEEIAGIEKKYKTTANNIMDEYIFEDVQCFGLNTNFSFFFDTNGNAVDLVVYAILDEDINSGKVIKETATNLLEQFASMFGCVVENNYFIFTDSGILDNQKLESYDKIYSGEATLEFRLRENKTSFWVLKIERAYQKQLVFSVEHHFDDAIYENSVANIDLS